MVLCTTGDGTTSEGEFWESLNTATNLKLPVVYLVEDNGYAISVPVEVNTAGRLDLQAGQRDFPGLFIQEVDGCDLMASFDVLNKAVDYARARKGPALVHAHVIRPYTHSLSDDEIQYRPPAEREADSRARSDDPIPQVSARAGHRHTGRARPDRCPGRRRRCRSRPTSPWPRRQPDADTVYRYVYSPDVDPTCEQFDTEDDPQFTGDPTTMVDLLNACMQDEMPRDPRIIVFGEDVADCSREENLAEVKGKGGVFKVTWGLQKEFGSERVYNSPLAEANIVGRAIGLAMRGFKPVVEIQFFDYIWPAYMQLRNELATMRWRSNNNFSSPVVVRVTYGGYIKAARSTTRRPARRCSPRPGPARRLSRDGARCQRPAAHRDSLRRPGDLPRAQAPVPPDVQQGAESRPELHDSVRQGDGSCGGGTDVTVVTYGAIVQRALSAAKRWRSEHGVSVEVIDLRSL